MLCVCVACSTLVAVNRLRTICFENQQRKLQEECRLIYALIEDDLNANHTADILRKLQSLGSVTDCRFTIVAEDGRAIVDTLADSAEMENHRVRPEIVAASAQGDGSSVRFSHTLQQEMMYLAHRVQNRDGMIYYLRLAVPMASFEQGIQVFDAGFWVSGAVWVLIGGAACYFFAWRFSAPIVDLATLAKSLSHGEIKRRGHTEAKGELGVFSQALNSMAESLVKANTEASKSKEELLTILRSMRDGVIATDLRQRVLLVNPVAGDLLGFAAGHCAGKALWEIIQEEAVLKAAAQVIASGSQVVIPVEPFEGRHLEVTISPLVHQDRSDGILIIVRDTTQFVRYQDLRKEFVANVSHELRTPLTLMMGFVETLRDGALQDPVKGPEFLLTVEKHTQQLSNLVDDLLEISKLESRPGLPRRVNVNLSEMIRRVIELMSPAALKKDQTLAIELPLEPLAVACDPDYVERALTNLLDNAIKYTPEKGRVCVSANITDSRATIEIVDTGIGIPAQDLPRIFERFYRVDKSRSREMGGTGLGLSIVKHIVQAHGGTVEVSSELGKGSKFRLIFPAI